MMSIAVAGLLGALTLGCGDDETTDPGLGEVGVHDNFFSPETMLWPANQAVTWVWQGTVAHNVTFEDATGSSDDMTMGTHQRTFVAPGTYNYRCTNHSTDFTTGMVGQVVVFQP